MIKYIISLKISGVARGLGQHMWDVPAVHLSGILQVMIPREAPTPPLIWGGN